MHGRTDRVSGLRVLFKALERFDNSPPLINLLGSAGNLIQTLLGGLEDDDPGTSHGAAGTSPVAQVQPEELD